MVNGVHIPTLTFSWHVARTNRLDHLPNIRGAFPRSTNRERRGPRTTRCPDSALAEHLRCPECHPSCSHTRDGPSRQTENEDGDPGSNHTQVVDRHQIVDSPGGVANIPIVWGTNQSVNKPTPVVLFDGGVFIVYV